MSEESNVVISPTKQDGYLESEHGPMEEHNPEPVSRPDESSSESIDVPAEHVQEDRQPFEPSPNEEQNRPLDLQNQKSSVEAVESSPSESQLTNSDAAAETKSLEKTNGIDQSAMKSTASTEISPSLAPSSDKDLKEVTENIQLIYEGMKGMKMSEVEAAGSASGKKGRKPVSTPRAKSTPVHLTSPPLTRSRSRDMKKFPSTPASPARSAARKSSESDSDEIKGVRGRLRVKKN